LNSDLGGMLYNRYHQSMIKAIRKELSYTKRHLATFQGAISFGTIFSKSQESMSSNFSCRQ